MVSLITAELIAQSSAPALNAEPFKMLHRSVSDAIGQAHEKLWGNHVNSHGVILDYVADLPTPDECLLGKPNSIGCWTPIENGPMFTGLYLPSACERAKRTGDPLDKSNARRLAFGLIKCASVSNVPGFIARGMGADGVCHYPLGSDDQTHPWFLGLYAYLKSGLASADDCKQIAAKMKQVADILDSFSWRCPCDGPFTGDFRGGFDGHLFRDAVRYLFLLRSMHEVTGESVWIERYNKALTSKPQNSERTRLEICAEGYALDRESIKGLDTHQLWIYVGSQLSLKELVALETDKIVRARFETGLYINAQNARPSVALHAAFDNNDQKVFGHSDWRKCYPDWSPQKTQEDARKQAALGDKTQQGLRKGYEAQHVRHPLAAAVIVALGDGFSGRDIIECAIRHYDYSKMHMAEFFFAECAYYAMPVL